MISRTKYEVTNNQLRDLFEHAGIKPVENITPLGAGEYNAVFAAESQGNSYAIKIAPKDDVPVMTLEKNLIQSEVFWYERIRNHTSIKVPQVYFTDFSNTQISAGYFIMEKLPGEQLDEMDEGKYNEPSAAAEMARMAAQMHKIKNNKFGYIQNELYDTWYLAIHSMVQNVLNDAAAVDMWSESGELLLTYIDKYKSILEKAPCTMVNFDIWEPNVLCRVNSHQRSYALIDPERSFWGDPVADFVCLESSLPLAKKKISLDAYNAIADVPIAGTREEQVRHAVMVAYLALIMEVEKYYRYTPELPGWTRNVEYASYFFNMAFDALDQD